MSGARLTGLRVWVTVVAATLALGPLVSPATVLCLGEDGHVGIEQAFAGCCQSGAAGAVLAFARSTAAGCGLGCGECTDVAIGQAVAPVPRGDAAPYPAAADRLTAPPPASPAVRCFRLPEVGTPSRDRDLAVVRATVLLR